MASEMSRQRGQEQQRQQEQLILLVVVELAMGMLGCRRALVASCSRAGVLGCWGAGCPLLRNAAAGACDM